MSDLQRAADLIFQARRITAFTGAGVSAESGIPTFRGAEDGLWKEYDSSIYADINYFKKDPTYFWSFFKDVRYRALVDSHPNAAHKALFKLEKMGKLKTVITQNIDGLHAAAGNTDVIELHGNTRVIGCLRCGAEYEFQPVYNKLRTQMPPLCDECDGILKPKVVFFGEALPDGAMERAAEQSMKCDLMIVVGSTLAVYPAASLPVLAARNGAKILIVNLGRTEMDNLADVYIDGKAGEALTEILALIPSTSSRSM